MNYTLEIKSLLVKNGLNQDDMAKKLGMSKTSMNYKILGKQEFKMSEAVKLVKELNVTLDQIFLI